MRPDRLSLLLLAAAIGAVAAPSACAPPTAKGRSKDAAIERAADAGGESPAGGPDAGGADRSGGGGGGGGGGAGGGTGGAVEGGGMDAGGGEAPPPGASCDPVKQTCPSGQKCVAECNGAGTLSVACQTDDGAGGTHGATCASAGDCARGHTCVSFMDASGTRTLCLKFCDSGDDCPAGKACLMGMCAKGGLLKACAP